MNIATTERTATTDRAQSTRYSLQDWGRYVRRNRTEYLGYPKRNIIHRMMKEGTGASQSTAPVADQIDDIPADVKALDAAMGVHITGRQLDILYARYVYRISQRKAARALEMSRDRYYRILLAAEAKAEIILQMT